MQQQVNQMIEDFYVKEKSLKNSRHLAFNLSIEDLDHTEFCIPLSDYLYRNYYCLGVDSALTENRVDHRDKNLLDETFVEKLKLITDGPTLGFDEGWRVKDHHVGGPINVTKGLRKNIFSAGQYLLSSDTTSLTIDSEVHRAVYAYSYKPKDYFFYFHGQHLDDFTNNFLVRFYFNVSADDAPKLLSLLIKTLNTYQLPFEMKCPANPLDFDRLDSIVLYLNRKNTPYFLNILEILYARLYEYLQSGVPLFTHEIYPGVGFAENPPKNSTSFGMSRCDLLAQGIYNCVEKNTAKKNWVREITTNLTAQGFDTDAFYLNPQSNYPYDIYNHTTRRRA